MASARTSTSLVGSDQLLKHRRQRNPQQLPPTNNNFSVSQQHHLQRYRGVDESSPISRFSQSSSSPLVSLVGGKYDSYVDAWNVASSISNHRHRNTAASTTTGQHPSAGRHPLSSVPRENCSVNLDWRTTDVRSSSDYWSPAAHRVDQGATNQRQRQLNTVDRRPDDDTMKIDQYQRNEVDDRPSSRRSSQDLGNWIDKYQKSDHHVDRLVRTVIQYEAATGQQFPDRTLLPVGAAYSGRPKTTAYISALPEVVYAKTSSSAGPVYADGQGQLRRMSVDRGPSSSSSSRRSSIVSTQSPQLQSVVYTASAGRPPRSSSSYLAVDVGTSSSRAASLPPPSPTVSVEPLTSYRRRPSVSSHTRTASLQGGNYASLPPRAMDFSSSSSRRSSYSGSRVNDAGLGLGRRSSMASLSWSATSGGGSRAPSAERTTMSYPLPTPPSTPNMSDTRRKIRRVLYKVSGDGDYLE